MEENKDWNWDKFLRDLHIIPEVRYLRRTVIDGKIAVVSGTSKGTNVYVTILVSAEHAHSLRRVLIEEGQSTAEVEEFHIAVVEEILMGTNTFDEITDPRDPLNQESYKEVYFPLEGLNELNVIELEDGDILSDYLDEEAVVANVYS